MHRISSVQVNHPTTMLLACKKLSNTATTSGPSLCAVDVISCTSQLVHQCTGAAVAHMSQICRNKVHSHEAEAYVSIAPIVQPMSKSTCAIASRNTGCAIHRAVKRCWQSGKLNIGSRIHTCMMLGLMPELPCWLAEHSRPLLFTATCKAELLHSSSSAVRSTASAAPT